MINARIPREAENASSTLNANKPPGSEQKSTRLKSRALEDVQNTLHSRPTNFDNSKSNSAVKVPRKPKLVTNEKFTIFTPKKQIYVSPTKPVITSSMREAEYEALETHNHFLCEHDEEHYTNDYFSEFKFSEEQINNLVLSAKTFARPFSAQVVPESEDIQLPDVEIFKESGFSISDILTDIIVPDVPPPLELF